jgi:hypothetical protein
MVVKYLRLNQKDTFTSPIITGISTSRPITPAKASLELIPKIAMATAMANSKLLLTALNNKYDILYKLLIANRNQKNIFESAI